MLRAIAYIRVSTDRQVTDGSSLVTQQRRVVEYAVVKGYKLSKVFVEEGESAKTDNRPVLQEMLRFCEAKKGSIDLLIFPKIDRFARYSEDYHSLKARLRSLGIRIESIDERFDDSPAGRFLESMLAATAQFDNDVRSERTYNGMREAVRQGRWVWRAPVGFRNTTFENKSTIEPEPSTAPLVIESFQKIATGELNVTQLRKWLNSRGLKLGRSSLYNILNNKIYVGTIEAMGLTVTGEPPIVPLVSESLFRRAQAAILQKNFPNSYRRDNPDFVLRGTVFCHCGNALRAGWSTGRRERYPYYRCHKCPNTNIRRELLEAAFFDFLKRFKGWFQESASDRARLEELHEHERFDLERHREHLQSEQKRTEQVLRSLVVKVAEGVIPDRLASEQLREFEGKLQDLNQKLAATDTAIVEPTFSTMWETAKEFLDQVHEQWQSGDLIERQSIQRLFFPHGARIVGSGERGTARGGQSTGWKSLSALVLSPLVGQADRIANTSACQALTERETLDFLRKVYTNYPAN